MAGHGGVAVATGSKTILGQIAGDVKELSVTQTPLQKKIVKFAQFIGLLVIGSAAAIIAFGLYIGMAMTDVFITAVAAAVAQAY